jgi:dolichyl-phosphate-mannose-protein mannosyltransferase
MYSNACIYVAARLTYGCRMVFLCWAINYLPFFLMNRVLFLHHYLTSSMFSIILAACIYEIIIDATHASSYTALRYFSLVLKVIAYVLLLSALAAFVSLAPLSYGTPLLSNDDAISRMLMPTWQIKTDF